MKPANLSWAEYLQSGIAYMEGMTVDGVRSFEKAANIFEEGADQDVDRDVKVESRFRRAQVAHYQRNRVAARDWINEGNRWLIDVQSVHVRAQCRLIEGMVREDEGHLSEAMGIFDELWEMDLTDQKLRGDIANRLARIYFEKSRSSDQKNDFLHKSCEWALKTVQCFSKTDTKQAMNKHAMMAAASRAGYYLDLYSKELWINAGAHDVHDRNLRASYWYYRMLAAFASWQPLRALWFGFRGFLLLVQIKLKK